MPAIVTDKFRIYAAEKFLKGLDDPRDDNNIYLFLGKTDPWTSADEADATETSPSYPQDFVSGHYDIWFKMMHLKKVNAANCSLGILRFDWVKNMVYSKYSQDVDLFDPTLGIPPFYVITDELNIYKCLGNNNGGPSFYKPTGTSSHVITTADKYKWKFMYNVSSADAGKYLTDHFIPIKRIPSSDNSKQAEIQNAAVDGSIDVVEVTESGSGYLDPPTVTIFGDGTGAEATALIKNGKVTEIVVSNRGSGYTYATATVTSGEVTQINITEGGSGYVSAPTVIFTGGSGAGAAATAIISNGSVTEITITNPGSGYVTAPAISFSSGNAQAISIISSGVSLKPIIPPPGGHGFDAVSELGGFFVIMDVTTTGASATFTVNNDFRQLGMILNPYLWGTETLATASYYNQSYDLTLTGVSGDDFQPEDIVEGHDSGAVGRVLDYDGTVLRLVNVRGTFEEGEVVSTSGDAKTGTLDSLKNPDLEPNSGQILYIEHKRPNFRSADSFEDIKFVCEF